MKEFFCQVVHDINRAACVCWKALRTIWKTLYSARKGAITAIIDLNDGDAAIGQRWARHKSMTTTLNVYSKAITP